MTSKQCNYTFLGKIRTPISSSCYCLNNIVINYSFHCKSIMATMIGSVKGFITTSNIIHFWN